MKICHTGLAALDSVLTRSEGFDMQGSRVMLL